MVRTEAVKATANAIRWDRYKTEISSLASDMDNGFTDEGPGLSKGLDVQQNSAQDHLVH
jgi:hypothetical protein